MKHIKLFEEFLNESRITENIASMINLVGHTPNLDFKKLIQVDKGLFYNSGLESIVSLALDVYQDKQLFYKVLQDLETEIDNSNDKSINVWIESMKKGRGSMMLNKNILDIFVNILYKYDPDNTFLKDYAYSILGNKATLNAYNMFQKDLLNAIKFLKKETGRTITIDNPNYQGVTGVNDMQKSLTIEVETSSLLQKLSDTLAKMYKTDPNVALDIVNKLSRLSFKQIKSLMYSLFTNQNINNAVYESLNEGRENLDFYTTMMSDGAVARYRLNSDRINLRKVASLSKEIWAKRSRAFGDNELGFEYIGDRKTAMSAIQKSFDSGDNDVDDFRL
jgi:hypothetical protein